MSGALGVKPELRAVVSELPDPPYPSTVKAGTFAFELDWARIKASKTWRLCQPDLRNHLLRIWAESWNEVPAGSWDDDLEMIASACDIPVNLLVAHRGVLLRNWTRHSDGRLYHDVISEMVLKIEETRVKWRQKRSSHYNSTKNVSGDTPESLPRVSRVSQPSSSSSSSFSVSSSKDTHASHESAKPSGSARTKPPCPHEKILALWQEILPELPQPKGVEHWTEARKSQLRARWNDQLPDLDTWRQMMLDIRSSPFLMGQRQSPGRKPFRCDLFWITTPERLLRLQEGRYDG